MGSKETLVEFLGQTADVSIRKKVFERGKAMSDACV